MNIEMLLFIDFRIMKDPARNKNGIIKYELEGKNGTSYPRT
jgi:hypothetical protein